MTELTVFSDPSDSATANCSRGVAESDAICTRSATPADIRFRELMGAQAWNRLPVVVRERFSKVIAPGAARVFTGTVTETHLSRFGRIVGTVARLVGGPLPFTDGATGPSNVVLTECKDLGGQLWTRTYARPGHFPQTINSVKRFAGPTGLEEYLGFGLVMRLTVHAEDAPKTGTVVHWASEARSMPWGSGGASSIALVFRSAGYAIAIGRLRLALPRFLSPGRCTITHRAHGPARFSFTLALDHPWAGRIATQVAYFEEITP